MNVASRDNRSGAVPVRLCAAIVGLAVGPLLGFAVAPDWWTQRGVISPNVSAKDYAVVNQGQLKNIAAAAAAELDAHLPGGAGDTLHNLIENWSQPNTQRNDFAPVNLGQVKNVAKGFYDRLISIRYVDDYPWAANTNASDDFAISNIGQVKNLFSFDLLATDVAHDSDQNGLPDWWEKYYFGHIGLDPNALAPRGDGLTILQAFQQGLDPITNSSTGITLTPHGVNAVVNARQSSSVSVVARNSSDQIRQLRATVAGNSVDELKYTDSDEEGGPPFIWNDISATGTHLERVSNADDDFESFAISFAFPYFGNSYSTVFVSSNGFVTLGEGSSDYKNNFLPDVSAPANEIAAFHNDLNLGDSGDVYYQDFGDRVIIQFTNAARYEGDGVSTFQIVLQRDGAILFYYKEMTGTLDEALVGIQNDTKDKGLTVAFRESYLKNNLAVRIVTSTSWVTVAPADFVLAPGESKTLGLNFDATAIDSGNFQGTLQVQDDTLAAQASINMTVNEGPEVAVTSPESGWVFLEGDSIELKARARDLDGVAKVEFYDSQNLLGESVSTNQLSFTWNSPSVGSHSIIARAVDNRGAAARSTAIQLYVQSDSNHNGIGDDWEMQYFGNLNQTADGDFDGDGLSNRQEFLSHTNPTLADTDGDGVSDGDEVNIYHTDARSSDSDHDGMDDGYEIHHHLNPNADDTHLDNDGDGLTNFEEFALGTDPEKWDTDGDGVSDKDDGWPLNKAVAPPPVPLMQYAVIDVSKTRIWGVNNSPDGLAYYPVDRVPVAVSVGDEFPGSYHSNNRLIFPLVFNDDDQIAGAFIQGDENGYFGNSQPWPVHAIIGDSPPILLCGETIHFSFSGIESYVTAFNTRGQVIVRSWVCPSGSPRDEALLASAGGLADDLGQVTGNLKLNNQGVVAASVNFQGLLIKNQQRVALPGWPAALTNEDAEGKETVVGYYDANDALYLWRDGIDGGVPLFDSHVNVAAAINSRLQIVGRTFLANTEVAALWENNRAYNFNDLISNPSEWTVNTATQINDRGMIFAQATHHLVSGPVPKITLVDVVLVPAALVPDYDRDGTIDDSDYGLVTSNNPLRWWINDDDDVGQLDGDDIPGQTDTSLGHVADYATDPATGYGQVDGMRDLVDFFPLYLNIKELILLLPPGADAIYKLKQTDSAVNFVYTDLRPEKAGDFLRALTGSGGMDCATALETATAQQVTASGVVLNTDWLNKIKDSGQGIILLEGRRATEEPLVLEIEDSHGQKLADIRFPLKIDGVEKMFRHINLMYVDSAFGGRMTELKEPNNYPDTLTNDKNFVFVHGFFVDPESARGWNCEIFKRLHQSGSNARFYGVTWHADEKDGTIVPEYHKNVDNAFATAYPLANLLANLGGDVTVAAHSLGNVAVSSAIQDWGAQPARYYMIDAAVALEAYDASVPTDDVMIHPDWISYRSAGDSNYILGDRVFASEWHLNPAFPPGDARRTLTWRDRFGNVGANTYNFYSSSEDVLRRHEGNPGLGDVAEVALHQGKYAWALQEKLKGLQITLLGGKIGSTYGGWQFTHNYFFNPVTVGTPSPAIAANLSNQSLITEPVFDPGFSLGGNPPIKEARVSHPEAPDNIVDLSDLIKGSDFADSHRNQLLAEMFPAQTLPAGANLGENFEERNFNMPALYINSSSYWPNGDKTFVDSQGNDVLEWHHSDFKVVAYAHLHRLFLEFCTQGQLNR